MRLFCAQNWNRTPTPLREPDFESRKEMLQNALNKHPIVIKNYVFSFKMPNKQV